MLVGESYSKEKAHLAALRISMYCQRSLTIQPVHYSFALLIFRPFRGCALNAPRRAEAGGISQTYLQAVLRLVKTYWTG